MADTARLLIVMLMIGSSSTLQSPSAIIVRQQSHPHHRSVIRASAVAPPSRATLRYDKMLTNFRQHSVADIELVAKPRYRGLLRGVSAAIDNDAVSTAFQVLYEDIGPVRVAGDLVFKKLDTEVSKSKESPAAAEVRALGREEECVVAARAIFDAVDLDASGTVSKEELLRSDLLRSLGQCADCTCGKEGSCKSVSAFMQEIDTEDSKEELNFSDFLVASHRFLYQEDASDAMFGGSANAEALVDTLLVASGRDDCGDNRGSEYDGDRSAVKHGAKFDAMCDEFGSWSSGDSMATAQKRNPRLALVLEGCFAGAATPSIVEALKILYVDFAALRLAGNLIFKLMRKLVK